jgi:preprotein translocase subunit SecA
VLAALAAVRVAGCAVDLTGTGLKAPSSTWTYLVNDDPFVNRLGAMLTGPGGVTVAIYSAAVMMPLLILWGLVEKVLRRKAGRRSDPFGR